MTRTNNPVTLAMTSFCLTHIELPHLGDNFLSRYGWRRFPGHFSSKYGIEAFRVFRIMELSHNLEESMRSRRAILYIPGNDPHKMEKGASSGVDCVALDLEDGVAENRKDEARRMIQKALTNLDFEGAERLVRVNGFGTGRTEADLQAVLAGRPDGTTLIPQSLSVLQTSEVRSVEPGLPADHFTLEIKAMFSGLTYRQADVTSLAQSVLVVNLPQGFVPVNETLIVSSSPDIKESAGEFTWEVHARQMVMQQVHEETLSGALTRMPLDQARNVLEANLNLLSPPEITLSPHWWKIMPFTPFRIQVEEQ